MTLVFCVSCGWSNDECVNQGKCNATKVEVSIPDEEVAYHFRTLLEEIQIAHAMIIDGDTGEVLESLADTYKEITGLPIDPDDVV